MGWNEEDENEGREPRDLGNVKYIRSTKLAMLVRKGNATTWVPFSVVHDDSEIHDGTEPGEEGKLVVFEWFAEQEQL